jgi:nitrogen regulation protein NR(I)
VKARILLIEDDAGTGTALRKVLASEGFEVDLVARGDEGLDRARAERYDLVITDFKLPGLSGLELIAELHRAAPRLPMIMMTAHGTTETAIEATKLGACEYVTKPFEADQLLDVVGDVLRDSRLMREEVELGESRSNGLALLGNSRAMQGVYKTIGRIATSPATVLIRGATGTGKELVARAIYQHSNRSDKPFIAVNCAAIPKELLESELFGHERGAFTGAQNRRIGRFEQAHGGTIFLDEVGDLPLETQAKLLRVLQERHFQRVGGDEVIQVDVRVVAATHRNLETALQEGEFREDLFYRLSVVTIEVPPLSDRVEDIPDLVRFFLRKYGEESGVSSPSIQPEAITFLQEQPWPGNVRELENTVREALLLGRPFGVNRDNVEQVIARKQQRCQAAHQTHSAYITTLLQRAQQGLEQDVFSRLIADLEPELYAQAFRLAQGNQAKAARWLGVTRLKMREKLIQLGLHPGREGGE